ncbi:MAG: GLPGLI family protein [Chlorobi bacterium]|nr:GLPGLI family protein [Chlorobiota bacterium]
MTNYNNLFFIRNLFLILMFSISLSTSAQLRFDYPVTEIEPTQLIVTYTLDYLMDTTNPNFIRNADMLLFLGENSSKFIGKEKYISDTIMRKITNTDEFQAFLMDRNRPFPKFSYAIFKNYPTKKITFIEHIIGGTFKFEEDLDLFNWQLSNDTATMCGYKVQKASCDFGGRSWVAWFSPEIPYSDGPYKFNGLPGLIVKIGDTREHYVFKLISIIKPEKRQMIDILEKDFIKSSKQNFFRAKDAFRDDILNRAKEAGLSSKDQQTAARNMAKRNNPIELIRK